MLRYAIVEIAGRQYKVSPGQEVLVNFLGEVTELNCEKVLAMATDQKLEIGKPYLADKLKFEVLGTTRAKKVRVATYSAKANTRTVTGARATFSKIKLQDS